MAIKTIMAVADGSQTTSPTLATAVAVAKKLGAHLEVLHVKPDPATMVPVVGEAMSGALVEQMIESLSQSAEKRAEQARRGFAQDCEGQGLSVAFSAATGAAPDIVGIRGRLADLIVTSRPNGDDIPTQTAVLDAALFDTGRPVVIAPAAAPTTVGENVVIAWNGSLEATRAVNGAVALLRLARSVTILCIGDDDRRLSAEALRTYLARHGASATIDRQANEPGPTGKHLIERSLKSGADLLVMGAYGHSRVRELILGGATHHVIAHGGLAVLMGH